MGVDDVGVEVVLYRCRACDALAFAWEDVAQLRSRCVGERTPAVIDRVELVAVDAEPVTDPRGAEPTPARGPVPVIRRSTARALLS